MKPDRPDVSIHRLIDLDAHGHATAPLIAAAATIFRSTAARWPAESDAARAFQDLWFDQYIRHERDLVWLAAVDATTPTVVGYLVGCRINPATSARFQSLSYFQTFAPLCAAFPAHLHINLDAAHRGQRIGERLIETFCAYLASEHIPGVHVVTGHGQRNVPFYNRLGFTDRARTPRGDTEVVFLARPLKSTGA